MDSQNRISQTSITTTVARQTPKRDFGDELVAVAGNGARIATHIVGSAVNGSPVVSAAVAGISGAVSAVSPIVSNPHAKSLAQATTTSADTELTPTGNAGFDTLAKQEQMNQESQAFSAMYLQLQSQMQQESREYQAISNIIKTRHDSAKAAINNIR